MDDISRPIKIRQKKQGPLAKMRENWDLYFFVLPGLILTFIYSYVPLYGITIAFKDFSARKGIFGSPWVGLEHFQRLFNTANFTTILSNTFVLSLYTLIAGFPLPIIMALLLNSMRQARYRKVIQTVTYAPNFISVVVMCGMLLIFLSPRIGIANNFLSLFGIDPVNFMAEQKYWRHIYVWSGIWQTTGYSSVIYFAALSSVSPEYHEAALVDGATKLQRVWYIDLPSIIPTVIIMLILNCGSILSIGFEKAFLLQNPLNLEVSEIINTYTYKMGLVNNDMSFSTAVGLFNSTINAALLILVNWISRRVSEVSLW